MSPDQEKLLTNLKVAIYFILAFTVVNLVMLAYDTRQIYTFVNLIHHL